MIVVDSSVWIDVLRKNMTPAVERFFGFEDLNVIITGDLILLEVLRGTQNDKHSENVRRRMEWFPVVTMLDRDLAIECAKNYRLLRARGIQVRKTADLIIGTYCIENHYKVLQSDKDFLPMVEHLGLQLA